MTTPILSRRGFVTQTAATVAAAAPAIAAERAGAGPTPANPLHVVCVGAHPDDPESCGGAVLRYIEAGHRATLMYLTRGEGGIPGKSNEETAAIRSAECLAALQDSRRRGRLRRASRHGHRSDPAGEGQVLRPSDGPEARHRAEPVADRHSLRARGDRDADDSRLLPRQGPVPTLFL